MTTPQNVAPTIVQHGPRQYVGISGSVTMQTINAIADRLPEVFGWLGEHGIEPAGAPFFRYHVIDMERQLEIEVGVPLADAVAGTDLVRPGVLPAGRYATLTHIGHPDELVAVTSALLDWAREHGLRWDVSDSPDGDRWGCRLEVYETDPTVEPDMNRWETRLEFRLAD